jgi:uncharacterized integral membrane protein
MGEKNLFQQLTTADKITVVLYRMGIVLSAGIIGMLGFLAGSSLFIGNNAHPVLQNGTAMAVLLFCLYFSIGLSVFFIHLYVGKFYRFLKRIYYLATVCLIVLIVMGSGNPIIPLLTTPLYRILLVPVAFCLGFVAAKEAFCFRLYEGYLLFALMPAYLVFCSAGKLSDRGIMTGMVVVSAMLIFFTLRKVFMPLHYDIGDKSAYIP